MDSEKTNAKILVIEDEGGIVDNIVYALKTEGFETTWCSTGMDGLKVLGTEDISLVILDVGLPDINGFELFKKIKARVNVPVIFLTARSEEIDRVVGLEIGADDYVTKPFSPRELTARVKAVLRRVGNKPEKTNLQPFEIDEKRNSINYFRVPLKLSRYEYRILKILIEHPGWVYSREKLMEMAWEEPDVSLLRTVDAHIKNMRQKLRKIKPDAEAIVTHHGSGYALAEDL
jgi:two-component system catabolic regulation response regulator CreB